MNFVFRKTVFNFQRESFEIYPNCIPMAVLDQKEIRVEFQILQGTR